MVDSEVIAVVRRWVETVVVGLTLCPFARRELETGRVRFSVTDARSQDALLAALQQELKTLIGNPRIETTILIHPQVLTDFLAYNQFLDVADALLEAMDLVGTVQIASFHPAYQFAGCAADDAENYSNRSPYPMLHLLREDSVALAVDGHPDIDSIPAVNQARLRALGRDELQALLDACFGKAGSAAAPERSGRH